MTTEQMNDDKDDDLELHLSQWNMTSMTMMIMMMMMMMTCGESREGIAGMERNIS